MEALPPLYQRYIDHLDVAFQPIVDIHSGAMFGVEALLRGTDGLGFETIFAFFDHLFDHNVLYAFDLALREKVIAKFCTISFHHDIKLFYNLDNRLFEIHDAPRGNTSRILKKYGLDHKSIVFELSEHNEIQSLERFTALMSRYKDEGFSVAIDDFGIGQSGYKMLYHATPHILKIDRFFLSDVHTDQKKKILARNMVQLATLMGCRVIAEGVETYDEWLVSKEIGCHWVQGYFIQRPTCDCTQLSPRYTQVEVLPFVEKRLLGDQVIIRKRLEMVEPICVNDSMEKLLAIFNTNPDLFLIPVIDAQGVPLGIIHEHRLKSIIYSPFGQSLIKNSSSNFSILENYVDVIPIVDVTMPLETIVELFSLHDDAIGVLVSESSKYLGYLSARVMIEAVHERNLIRARDQNPLSRLPGNFRITEYIAHACEVKCTCAFCYFDFDHFKPFNDYYGFRNGDRAIVLFAELMGKILLNNAFIGHIGGDDFFAGALIDNETMFDQFVLKIREVIEKFGEEVQEFYHPDDRQRGYIIADDRHGIRREFKLLSVSAVLVYKTGTTSIHSADHLQHIFAKEKKNAKRCSDHLCVIRD
ncbi:MAG: GGDEF domain-containing protein [Sulfuricurvum sp.]